MTARSKLRGHDIVYINGAWVYADTGLQLSDDHYIDSMLANLNAKITKLEAPMTTNDNNAGPTNSETQDRLDMAWGIIANVSGGDWDQQTDEWRAAAEKWRDDHDKTQPHGSSDVEIPMEDAQ